MGDIETVKVKIKSGGHDAVINKSDYNPDLHELQGEARAIEGSDGLTDEERVEFARLEAKRKHDANRGVSAPAGAHVSDKNPSGTYSEPTPTDIRYPNKDETEFENNHGATVGKSAAQMRENEGLPDAPGGLAPEAPHVGKGPRGKFYVKKGTERVAGPFDTEAEAKASMAGDTIADNQQSVEQEPERQ